jgi:hypothetical protein
MDVLSLLKSKNRCLRRFLALSEDFSAVAAGGDLAGLAAFQQGRESLLRAIGLFDRKLAEAAADAARSPVTPELREGILALFAEREGIVQKILTADERVLALIEAEKTRIRGELSGSRKQQEKMKRFKSAWVPPSGEELDTSL